jgi:hypothetical protein
MKKERRIRFAIPIVIGFVAGFLVLHPASMVIVDLFEKAQFSIADLLARVQGGSFLPMGLYFSFLGCAIGLLFSINSNRLNRTNTELLAIINSIKERNAGIRERAELQKPRVASAVREMRPTLNKIQKLVDLITQGNAGSINMRQTTLLSITKGNIDNLFHVIDYLLEMVERETDAVESIGRETHAEK